MDNVQRNRLADCVWRVAEFEMAIRRTTVSAAAGYTYSECAATDAATDLPQRFLIS
jgi:hypothetical protein